MILKYLLSKWRIQDEHLHLAYALFAKVLIIAESVVSFIRASQWNITCNRLNSQIHKSLFNWLSVIIK